MKRKTEGTAFSRIASVCYWVLVCCYTIAYGAVVLGWITIDMTGLVTGSFGLLAVNAVFITLSVIMIGCIIVLLHGALVLWAPRREDGAIYVLYQAAGFSFSVIGLCVGMVLNSTGLMNVLLSIPYYVVMFVFPFLGGIAFGRKRREQPSDAGRRESAFWDREILAENDKTEHGIRCIMGEYEGTFFPLGRDEELVLGTDPSGSHVLFHDPRISRRHCVIQYNSIDENYYVMDCSTNGTFLMNGTRLPYQRAVICVPGTVITIARESQMFQFI